MKEIGRGEMKIKLKTCHEGPYVYGNKSRLHSINSREQQQQQKVFMQGNEKIVFREIICGSK